jgi:hypothetical protein
MDGIYGGGLGDLVVRFAHNLVALVSAPTDVFPSSIEHVESPGNTLNDGVAEGMMTDLADTLRTEVADTLKGLYALEHK